MGSEQRPTGFSELGPPQDVAVDRDRWLRLTPIGSLSIDIRHLPRPLDTIDHEPEGGISDKERELRDEYIALCEAAFSAVWHETEMFVATTSIDEAAELDESAIFNTKLAFDELIQNAFRHGGRPQRLWVSIVEASDNYSLVPRQADDDDPVHLRTPQAAASIAGNRVLLGVQDASPNWHDQPEASDEEFPENLRGLDIVRGVSKAIWYQSNETNSKWVWTLI